MFAAENIPGYSVLLGTIIFLATALGYSAIEIGRRYLPKQNLFTEKQDQQLTDLHGWHNSFEDDGITPRWHKEPGVLEALQETVSLLQSMQRNMVTESTRNHETYERILKAFDEMFELMREHDKALILHTGVVDANFRLLLDRKSASGN